MSKAFFEEVLTLETVQEHFESWRTSRSSRRDPIPEHLWQAAVRLCRYHLVSHISRRLRLSHSELKKRTLRESSPRPDFLSINLTPPATPVAYGWHMECQRADGARMCISGQSVLPDIATLLGRFLS